MKRCKVCGASATRGSIAYDVWYCWRSAKDINWCDGVDRLGYD